MSIHRQRNTRRIAPVEARTSSEAPAPGRVLEGRDTADFVLSAPIEAVVTRALAYLTSGYSIHLTGPAGTGKTTLALIIAEQLGNAVELMQGDDGLSSNEALGRTTGFSRTTSVDNYIHSVVSRKEDIQGRWVESRLSRACRLGHTLIYDEFNRSAPSSTNVLLAALSEGIIALPHGREDQEYLKVHASFRVILTSNPAEYAGVHATQNALLDRVISISVSNYDLQTECDIVSSRAEISQAEALKICELTRKLRACADSISKWPSLRAAIAAGRVLQAMGAQATPDDEVFRWICHDIFNSVSLKEVRQGDEGLAQRLRDIIDDYFSSKSPTSYS